jgi:3',5'-cyclic AMP phosphodiesterase CpdA
MTSEAEVVVANSAYHGNHQFGLVDVDSLPTFSGTRPIRLLVTHHNLIGIHNTDISTTRNGHAVLLYAMNENVDAVLHGHQHMQQILPFGRRPGLIVGGGSLNFLTAGLPNQFNVVEATPGAVVVWRYVYHADAVVAGKLGGWIEQEAYANDKTAL